MFVKGVFQLTVVCAMAVSVCSNVVKRQADQEGVLETQASAISELQARVTALENTASESDCSCVELQDQVSTLSQAVAFSVRYSADESDHGVSLSPHSTLVFDRVTTNVGNGYNPTTGVFTAPVSGLYAFSLNMMMPNADPGNLEISIVKDGVILDLAWAPNGDASVEGQGSANVVFSVLAGERVWVRQEAGVGVRGGYFTVFTGYLVHPL